VSITVTYAVKGSDADKRPQLMIPKKLMVAAASSEGESQAEAPARSSLFAGIALAATFVTGGLWLARRGGKGARGLLVLCIVSGAFGLSTCLPQLLGNVGPTPDFKKTIRELEKIANSLTLQIDGRSAKLGVDIVIVTDGDRIQLVLPDALAPASMAKPAEAPKKAE